MNPNHSCFLDIILHCAARLVMNHVTVWSKQFVQTHEHLKHSIAGAGAGIVSSIATCPLDVVKTRLQNQGFHYPGAALYKGTADTLSRIWKEEGIRGLYRGLGPTIFGYLPTWAIYFTTYDHCKNRWARDIHDTWVLHVTSAVLAGVASTSLTNPLWVIKTRLMTQNEHTAYRYNNTFHAFSAIAKEEGIRGFYKGLGPSLVGVSHVAVQFPMYEKLKHCLQDDLGMASGTMAVLVASSLSKMIASMITYPHEVIRTRLQNQTKKPFKYHGIIHALQVIKAEEGLRGFYKGMATNLLRTVPASALTIFTYEVIVHKMEELQNSSDT